MRHIETCFGWSCRS